ncbi:MAG: D-aminoacylase, partial [Acidobacteria bacterium]|nr:D-aminoacylase [Acidobacteriota bacterium]
MRLHKYLALLLTVALTSATAAQAPRTGNFDVLIKGGTVYDGTGRAPRRVDVAIRGDRIVVIGNLSRARAHNVIDARGLAVAPGFINMLSWSTESLIVDGRSQGEIRQGVTTQIMGEGWSMGPLNERLKKQMIAEQDDIKFDIEWTTLAEYLKYLEKRGVSQNVASFVGATTVRQYVLGESDVQPTEAQLQ